MFYWVLLILLVNGIVAFVYTAMTTTDPSATWGMFATAYIYFVGITQTGIVFSAMMRIAKSKWGLYFGRLGEILTFSFIPVSIVMFIAIYCGGLEHLFYWAAPDATAHGPISPWLNKDFFLWRHIITTGLFYLISFWYFSAARSEEKGGRLGTYSGGLNALAAFVMFFYVWANTNMAWDFGMMIIRHWESTIFAGYFWVGNIFACAPLLYIMSFKFITRRPGRHIETSLLDPLGKFFMGFTLTWIYMFWSQHVVTWYADLPNRTAPLIKQTIGAFQPTFMAMLLFVFIVPFIALLFRKIKLNYVTLYAVGVIILAGIWFNRYLMVVPVFADGTKPVFATWMGLSLLVAGFAAMYLSVACYRRLFPGVTVTTFDLATGAKLLEDTDEHDILIN